MTARDVIADALRKAAPTGESCEMKARWISEALTAAGYSIVHESEIHGATVDRFRQEIKRLKPHYQHQTTVNAGRRQMLEHFEVFACRALPDGGVDG